MLNAVERGDAVTAEELLPIVHEELRRLARYKLAGEPAGHTLQATALVHEAGLRQAVTDRPRWPSRAHFFAAAAEAMRRILVKPARRKPSLKRGGGAEREEFSDSAFVLAAPADELLAVHEALDKLAVADPPAAELVKLRYFVGLTMDECASALGMGRRSAANLWSYARVWLRREIRAHD